MILIIFYFKIIIFNVYIFNLTILIYKSRSYNHQRILSPKVSNYTSLLDERNNEMKLDKLQSTL